MLITVQFLYHCQAALIGHHPGTLYIIFCDGSPYFHLLIKAKISTRLGARESGWPSQFHRGSLLDVAESWKLTIFGIG